MRILSRYFSFAVNLDKQNFSIKMDQIKPKFVKCEFLSLYFQMWIVLKNLFMELDRSKQRIFEILIFIDFLLLIILNYFPIEENQTEQTIFYYQFKESF